MVDFHYRIILRARNGGPPRERGEPCSPDPLKISLSLPYCLFINSNVPQNNVPYNGRDIPCFLAEIK